MSDCWPDTDKSFETLCADGIAISSLTLWADCEEILALYGLDRAHAAWEARGPVDDRSCHSLHFSGTLYCTRRPGHRGPHIAAAGRGRTLYKVWEDETFFALMERKR